LSVPGFGATEVGNAPNHDSEPVLLSVFGNELAGVDQGNDAAGFFSRLLERDIRLLRVDRDYERWIPEEFQRPGAANQVAGADGLPFLLVSQASLDAQHKANAMDIGRIPINSYRGNIALGGYALGSFGEDYVLKFRIGDMAAWVVNACARCPIPNIDQETGESGSGGLRVLRGRAGHIETEEMGMLRGVFFGQNMNHVYVPGQIVSKGDNVHVLEKAEVPNVQLRAA
jgi:uncharacterized protein YcbX